MSEHAQIGILQLAGRGGRFDGVVAVVVSDGLCLTVLHSHYGSRQGFSLVVAHRSFNLSCAAALVTMGDGDDGAVDGVLAAELGEYVAEHALCRYVLHTDGHQRQLAGQLCVADKVETSLFLHLCKEFFHACFLQTERHGLAGGRLCQCGHCQGSGKGKQHGCSEPSEFHCCLHWIAFVIMC